VSGVALSIKTAHCLQLTITLPSIKRIKPLHVANVESVVYGYMKCIVWIDVLCIFLPKLFVLTDLYKIIKTRRFSCLLPPLVRQRLVVVLNLFSIELEKDRQRLRWCKPITKRAARENARCSL